MTRSSGVSAPMNRRGESADAFERRWIPILLVLTALLALAGQFNHDLWTPDEPRVAAVMVEMAQTSDYIVPHLAGEPFVEKPPLYFALGALFDSAFAPLIGDLAALRLLNAALALGTLTFFFLLARRLFDRRIASWAVIVLGSTVGFVSNAFWLRVDAALGFFVTAAIWAFCEGFLMRRPGAMIGAGVLTAGAFLVKGPIGPAMIFFPWLVLVARSWLGRRSDASRHPSFWLAQAASLGCFLIPVAAWMMAMRLRPDGEQLWYDWFWQNQIGRSLGTAKTLGHLRPDPLYYLGPLALYLMPWLPFLLLRAWRDLLCLLRTRRLAFASVLLWVWASGAIVLLSSVTTKRAIYLLPSLPALALLAASVPIAKTARWLHDYALAWAALGFGVSLLLGSTPLFASRLTHAVPAEMLGALSSMSLGKVNALLAAALLVWVLLRMRTANRALTLLGLANAVLLWVALTVAVPALDRVKSMSEETRRFIAAIPEDQRARVAGFNFGETELGIFYFYERWAVARLTEPGQVIAILEGRDAHRDSVMINWNPSRPGLFAAIGNPLAYRVLAEAHPRGDRDGRGIYWLAGERGPHRLGRSGETPGSPRILRAP